MAAGRPYRVDPAPNYGTAQDDRGAILTDTRHASGLWWTNGTSLGWAWQSLIKITLDLGGRQRLGHVRIQSGAKRAGQVLYPSHVLVYGGDGRGNVVFLGSSGIGRDEDSPDTGATRVFDIRVASHEVTELIVVGFARGAFLFIGEIEAYPPIGLPDVANSDPPAWRPLSDLHIDAVERRRQAIAALPDPKPRGPDPARRWFMPLASVSSGERACTIQRVEPWPDAARRGDGAAVVAEPIAAHAPLVTNPGGRDYAAFRVVNATDQPRVVDIWADAAAATLSVHVLAHAQALSTTWVDDVVTPFAGAELPARSAMTLLVEATPNMTGRSQVSVQVACGAETATFAIPVLSAGRTDDVRPLHGTQWVYVHQGEHASVSKTMACDAEVLDRYGIDTAVVHPDALRDDRTERPTALLRHYFRTFRTARRVLLGMDVKTRPWRFKTQTDAEATATFVDWWAWVNTVAAETGAHGELILYPIDEPQPADVPLLERTRDLMRAAGVGARVYATLEPKVFAALPWLDIGQVLRPEEFPPPSLPEVHAYDTRPDGKLLSLHGYYRLQAWRALGLGLAGIGFWAAWDSTGHDDPGTGWNPFTGMRERDFGVFYAAPGGCGWPSRRLLAWRRGLEEVRILTACAGSQTAARDVITSRMRMQPNAAALRSLMADVANACVP